MAVSTPVASVRLTNMRRIGPGFRVQGLWCGVYGKGVYGVGDTDSACTSNHLTRVGTPTTGTLRGKLFFEIHHIKTLQHNFVCATNHVRPPNK